MDYHQDYSGMMDEGNEREEANNLELASPKLMFY